MNTLSIEVVNKWYVLRHEGRADDAPWRLIIATRNEAQARRVYATLLDRIRYGAIRLYNPDGQCILNHVMVNEPAAA